MTLPTSAQVRALAYLTIGECAQALGCGRAHVARIRSRRPIRGRPPRHRPGPITVQLPPDLDAGVRAVQGHTPRQAVECAVYGQARQPCPVCIAMIRAADAAAGREGHA